MKKKIIIGIAALAALSALILPKVLRREPFAEGAADPIVEVTQPEVRDIRLTTGLVGEVEPEDVVYVYPKASGEVTEVKVKAGGRGGKGAAPLRGRHEADRERQKLPGLCPAVLKAGSGGAGQAVSALFGRRNFPAGL